MFCPQCEGEYREGITLCPTCEVGLVEDLSQVPLAAPEPMPARLASAMVDLVGYVDEVQARDARARLKAVNIPCELVVRDAFGPPSETTGDEYWIRVPGSSAGDAVKALGTAALTLGDLEETPPDLQEDRCPSCGASLGPDEDCTRCLDASR